MHRNLLVWSVAFLLISGTNARGDADSEATKILKQSGFQGGFIVCLGAEDGALPLALRASDSTQVHSLVWDQASVSAARSAAAESGIYGDVSVDHIGSFELPYVDNLVNLLVVDDLGDSTVEECQRVLVPGGVLMIRDEDGQWTKTIKPRPGNIDEWSHYLHDASGNSVAHDDVVAPPRHLQWVGSPRWSRHHDRMASMSALVSTGGRMFYIMDEGSRVSIQMPSDWKLIARDAFNGSVLWQRDIPRVAQPNVASQIWTDTARQAFSFDRRRSVRDAWLQRAAHGTRRCDW